MSSIVSSLSGQFSKLLILGTFLPTSIFVVLALVLVVPLYPFEPPIPRELQVIDVQWQVVTLTLVTLVVSGILYNFNIPIIRFYEGYPWQNSWIGRRRTKYYIAKFNETRVQRAGLRVLRYELKYSHRQSAEHVVKQVRARGQVRFPTERRLPGWLRKLLRRHDYNTGFAPEVLEAQTRIGRRLVNQFPSEEQLVLPTKLGNVIRSFEDYPRWKYGMDGVFLWMRMVGKIDKEYAAVIDDAKTSFDFVLNCSFLSGILSLVLLGMGLYYTLPLNAASIGAWLGGVLAFAALSFIFYFGSLERAAAWGDTVKSAFDLYRWELLKQLGYKQVPTTVEQEIEFWQRVSREVMVGFPPQELGRPLSYDSSSAFARGEVVPGLGLLPSAPVVQIDLSLSRGVHSSEADGNQIIILSVENATDYRLVKSVVVRDAIMEGFKYLWGSASARTFASGSGGPADRARDVTVSGSGPYDFHVGDLLKEERLEITYKIMPEGGSKPLPGPGPKAPETHFHFDLFSIGKR